MKSKKTDNMSTLEIIQGISQAVANKHDGSREDDGKGEFQKIGLRREEETPFTDRRLMDGFGVSINGNKLKLNYHSEIHIKEVYGNKFEDKIVDIMEQCVSFLKKEYKKVTKNTLSLKKIGEEQIRVEHMNKVRSWVTAYCLYEIAGIEKPDKLGDTFEKRLDKKVKDWLGLSKKD